MPLRRSAAPGAAAYHADADAVSLLRHADAAYADTIMPPLFMRRC